MTATPPAHRRAAPAGHRRAGRRGQRPGAGPPGRAARHPDHGDHRARRRGARRRHLPRRRARRRPDAGARPAAARGRAGRPGRRRRRRCWPSTRATRCSAPRYVTPDGTRHDGLGVLDVRSSRATTAFLGPVDHPRPGRPGPGRAERLREPPRHDRGGYPAPSRSPPSSWATATTAPRRRPAGHVIGTYLHGPLLARNADLADLLLGWATGATLDAGPLHHPTPCAPSGSPRTAPTRAGGAAGSTARPRGARGRRLRRRSG